MLYFCNLGTSIHSVTCSGPCSAALLLRMTIATVQLNNTMYGRYLLHNAETRELSWFFFFSVSFAPSFLIALEARTDATLVGPALLLGRRSWSHADIAFDERGSPRERARRWASVHALRTDTLDAALRIYRVAPSGPSGRYHISGSDKRGGGCLALAEPRSPVGTYLVALWRRSAAGGLGAERYKTIGQPATGRAPFPLCSTPNSTKDGPDSLEHSC